MKIDLRESKFNESFYGGSSSDGITNDFLNNRSNTICEIDKNENNRNKIMSPRSRNTKEILQNLAKRTSII